MSPWAKQVPLWAVPQLNFGGTKSLSGPCLRIFGAKDPSLAIKGGLTKASNPGAWAAWKHAQGIPASLNPEAYSRWVSLCRYVEAIPYDTACPSDMDC